jgi:hypothetical protein
MSSTNNYDVRIDEALETVGRLTNLAGAAEGTNLPPRQQGVQRVAPPTGFRVLSNTPFSGGEKIVLTWNTPENKTAINAYRIYAFNTTANSATNPASTTASAVAPVAVDMLASPGDVIVFRIQTVLANGLTLPISECPSCGHTIGTPSWTAATLENSWVNFGSGYTEAAYYKDTHGFVHVRGTIKDGTTTDGTTILTLPTGYRPTQHGNYLARNNTNVGLVVVNAGGTVTVGGLTSATELSLNGIYFSIY